MASVHPKVQASTASSAAVVLLVYIVSLFGVDLPDEVQLALVVLVGFFAGYVKSSGDAA